MDVAVAAGGMEPKQAAGPDQAQPRKKSRAVQPGSFLALLMKAQHEKTGAPFSDTAIVAQAFTFLLAGTLPSLAPTGMLPGLYFHAGLAASTIGCAAWGASKAGPRRMRWELQGTSHRCKACCR